MSKKPRMRFTPCSSGRKKKKKKGRFVYCHIDEYRVLFLLRDLGTDVEWVYKRLSCIFFHHRYNLSPKIGIMVNHKSSTNIIFNEKGQTEKKRRIAKKPPQRRVSCLFIKTNINYKIPFFFFATRLVPHFVLSPPTNNIHLYASLLLPSPDIINLPFNFSLTPPPTPVFTMSYRGSFRGRGRGSSSGSGSNTRFTGKRRGRGGGGGGGGGVAYGIDRRRPAAPSNQATREDGTAATERFEEVKVYDEIDEKIGFWRFESVRAEGEEKIGWLVNMHQVSCSVWC